MKDRFEDWWIENRRTIMSSAKWLGVAALFGGFVMLVANLNLHQ